MANEYVEVVAKYLLGKEVEVYFSTDHTVRSYADYEIMQKAVVRGILEAVDTCTLVIKCQNGARAFLNSWNITFVVDGSSSVGEILDPSKGGGRK